MAGTSQAAADDRGGSRSQDDRTDFATEAFVAHRNLLFTVAYEMLGSATDAEDVRQETWLRWAGVDLDTVENQRAYLVRITTRQALVRLRTLGRRKESYVGPGCPSRCLRPAQVNGYPALILRLDGKIDTVIAVRIDDGLITGLYAVRNPEKLSRMNWETALRR